MINKAYADKCVAGILHRRRGAGGFSEKPDGIYRPDSTAWAVMAIAKAGLNHQIVEYARITLEANQLEDGRVAMPSNTALFWPTPLAVLAWHGPKKHHEAEGRALQFLLETSRRHWERKADSPAAHDTSIRG